MSDTSTVCAITLFPSVTMLDVIGPYEALWRVPGVDVVLVAAERGPVRAGGGGELVAAATFSEVPHPEIVLVPGGPGTAAAQRDAVLLEYLRRAAATADWVVSVCSGSLVLASAGLLEGRRASTYWASRDVLRGMGVDVSTERVTFDGNVVTASGVSAGVDLGLRLAARLAGDDTAAAIQLGMEYAPEPPFEIGGNEGPPPDLVQRFEELRAGWPAKTGGVR
jgi:transcriptional regulator GlxA family with amidase domain